MKKLTFGEMLRYRRKKILELSLKEFSELAGISHNYLYDLEGKRGSKVGRQPSVKVLSRISKVAACRNREQALQINDSDVYDWSKADVQFALRFILEALEIEPEFFDRRIPAISLIFHNPHETLTKIIEIP